MDMLVIQVKATEENVGLNVSTESGRIHVKVL